MSMPTSLAASTSSMPLGASTSRPSMESLTVSTACVTAHRLASLAPFGRRENQGVDACWLAPCQEAGSPWLERTSTFPDVVLVLRGVLLHGGDDRAGSEVAQCAQHLAADLTAERQQQLEVAR